MHARCNAGKLARAVGGGYQVRMGGLGGAWMDGMLRLLAAVSWLVVAVGVDFDIRAFYRVLVEGGVVERMMDDTLT